ncbi:MAG: MFS transporter, partial [Abitibacteriaceae bacterium]|nr:MFS transporter [Abditibacteriaceae bacterium]
MKIYIFPFLIDLITFLVMLRLADAAGREMHVSNLQTSWFMVSYSACFLVACLWLGRRLHRGNSRPILIASITVLMVLAVPLFFTTSFWPTIIIFSAYGVTVAAAFNSFQTFMRGEAPAGSLGLTLARYTISWSSGIACGFLLGGILKDVGGPFALSAFTTLACLSILYLVLTHQTRDEEHASADATVEEIDPAVNPRAPRVDSRYVAIGWSLCVSANFSQRPLTTFIPKFHAESGSPAWVAGFLLFTLFLAQAISG